MRRGAKGLGACIRFAVLYCVYLTWVHACINVLYMEKTLTVRVVESELELWREAAWAARLSLSEWVRGACDARAGLAAGDEGRAPEVPAGEGRRAAGGPTDPGPSPRSPAASSFRPDFKKGK